MSRIYLRNGVWQIQHVDNGKAVQRSLKTTDPAKADALRVIHRGVGSVGELAAAYVRHAEVYYRKHRDPTSEVNITRLVCNRYLKPYHAWSIPEFTPLALQKLRDTMIAKPLHRTTIDKYCAVVKAAFKWGVSQTMVPVRVYQALACAKGLAAGRSEARDPNPSSRFPRPTSKRPNASCRT